MFLARDHVGVKPMFYSLLPDGMFVFGSELKSIMTHPELSRELNPRAVEDYFAYGYVPEPHTIFHNALQARARPPLDAQGRRARGHARAVLGRAVQARRRSDRCRRSSRS